MAHAWLANMNKNVLKPNFDKLLCHCFFKLLQKIHISIAIVCVSEILFKSFKEGPSCGNYVSTCSVKIHISQID